MKVVDLYIALVLVGACAAIGWELHKAVARNDERMVAMERQLRIQGASSTSQLAAALRSDPLLKAAYDVLAQRMKSEEAHHA